MHIFTANDSIESNKCKFNWTIFHNRARRTDLCRSAAAVHDNRTSDWIMMSLNFTAFVWVRISVSFSFQYLFERHANLKVFSQFFNNFERYEFIHIAYISQRQERKMEKKETKQWKPSQNCTSPNWWRSCGKTNIGIKMQLYTAAAAVLLLQQLQHEHTSGHESLDDMWFKAQFWVRAKAWLYSSASCKSQSLFLQSYEEWMFVCVCVWMWGDIVSTRFRYSYSRGYPYPFAHISRLIRFFVRSYVYSFVCSVCSYRRVSKH